jgi:hypothetical protein
MNACKIDDCICFCSCKINETSNKQKEWMNICLHFHNGEGIAIKNIKTKTFSYLDAES